MIKFSKEKEEEIIRDYLKGKNTVEIAKKHNTYNTSIRRVLLRNNITLRSGQKVNRLCKHNPFKRKDEYSEYFLGLLLTDGCITYKSKTTFVVNLSLSEKDGYIVEKFRDWASPNAKVSKIFQPINGSYMYSINIANCDMVDWLRLKGNFYRKSYECKIYTPITWNILRGIFDGDGGFRQQNKNGINFFVCGKSLIFINQIAYFLSKNDFHPVVYTQHGLYYVSVYRQKEVVLLGEYLYNNAHIFLKRKYERWLAFYESKKANGVNSGKEMAIQS